MTQISKEYAQALFSLAEESGCQKEVSDALKVMSKLFEQNPDYLILLSAPNIPKKERAGLLAQAFGGSVGEPALSFVQLLCEKGHIQLFGECADEYEALRKDAENITTAEVTSAVPLTEEEQRALKAKLEKISKHTVVLRCTADSSLIGGVVVRMDGKILDGSLRHRLREWKEGMRDAAES